MSTSPFWRMKPTVTKAELEKLRKEKEHLEQEIEMLRTRDLMKTQIERAKKEKFYRSPTGRALTRIGHATKIIGEQSKIHAEKFKKEWESPKARKERSKLGKDLMKIWRKL